MKLNTKLDDNMVTFKLAWINIMLVVIGIRLFNGVFAKEFDLPLFIAIITGVGIGMPLTYYFLSNRSFKPMKLPKFALTAILNIGVSSLIALLAIYIFDLF